MLLDLPELVLDLIYDHLSYEDVLVLRSTCKGLKWFVDGKPKFTKLNLFIHHYSFHHRLFYTEELIGYPHSYRSNDLSILNAFRFREQFVNVQRMICYRERHYLLEENYETFDLELLNCFAALRHLEISKFFCIKGNLNLQELRIAAFRAEKKVPNLSSELDCPRLKALAVRQFKPALSGATNQLEYLQCCNCENPTGYLKSISPNLRRLSAICFKSQYRFLEFLSSLKTNLNLPSLSQIKLDHGSDLEFPEKLNEMASGLENLKRHSVKQIQFTFNGRSICQPDKLRQIASLIKAYDLEAGEEDELYTMNLTDRTLAFLNGNSELEFLLSAACWSLNLDEDTEMSEELIKKLKNLTAIKFRNECKPSHATFELFARSCKSLRYLTLVHQMVTEPLLEMMANRLVNLQCLSIFECQFETVKPLVKFRNLEILSLDLVLTKSELMFIFENSRTVEVVLISREAASFHLIRTTTGPKMRTIGSSSWTQFQTLQGMIDYYYDNYESCLVKEFKTNKASTRLNQS